MFSEIVTSKCHSRARTCNNGTLGRLSWEMEHIYEVYQLVALNFERALCKARKRF
jgi:hypothetical protein